MPEIFALSEQAVDQLAAIDPVAASEQGIAGYDDAWTDLSPAGRAARRALFVELLDAAQQCDEPDAKATVAKLVLIAECNREIEHIDGLEWTADVNNIVSPWQGIRTVYSMMGRDDAGWRAIVTRLSTTDQALAGYRMALEAGLAANKVAARRQVMAAISQGRQAAGDQSSLLDLLTEFAGRSDSDTSDLGEDFASELGVAVKAAMAAFGEMTAWFENVYLPAAPTADGIGAERYVTAASQFLGERIDPIEIYAWGWSELNRLWAELTKVCAEIDPDATVTEVMHMLGNDPDRAVEGVPNFIATMQERQELALANLLGEHFDLDQRVQAVEVLAAPPGGASAPYYTGPSEDFSRPGRVWYPVDGRDTFPLFGEITTAYHEGFPGHHLQIGWQATMDGELSRFHRTLVWYPGSGEGWALYAEHLMGELGYLERPDYVVGLLASQLFRSSRIVIDIGSHLELAIPDDAMFEPGETWTFDRAVKMLREVAFLPPSDAESEIIRYLGWPGQAISYKLGEKALLDLRTEAEANGMGRKEFHAKVLSAGSVGLDLLRQLVRA